MTEVDRDAVLALADPLGRLAVRVTPKARRAGISSRNGVLRVDVTAAPEKGRANAAVLAAVAKLLGVPKSALTILRGETGRDKLLQLPGELLPGRRT